MNTRDADPTTPTALALQKLADSAVAAAAKTAKLMTDAWSDKCQARSGHLLWVVNRDIAHAILHSLNNGGKGSEPSRSHASKAVENNGKERKMRTQNWFVMGLIILLSSAPSYAVDGLIKIESRYSPKTTMDRLEAAVLEKNMKVFARIDHAAGAASIGETLHPTQLLIFGNPKGGTPFMKCAQTVAIDLPLKALVWQDRAGRVWLGYNDPAYLARRHAIDTCPVVSGMSKALAGFAATATSGN